MLFFAVSLIIQWLHPFFQQYFSHCKNPKNSGTRKICCNHSKICISWLYHRDADGMANSVDNDQTAPSEV